MKPYLELHHEFLQAMVAQADLWEQTFGGVCSPTQEQRERYHACADRVGALRVELILHPDSEALSVHLRGFDPQNDHYSIDVALRKRFGDSVAPDSESGEFQVDCAPAVADEVQTFLAQTFPTLSYERIDVRAEVAENPQMEIYATIPGGENWPAARLQLSTPASNEQAHP